jgi:antitoxin (DNA-binding transcriptional repressor) of toxin-antitoxin stability system
VDRAAAGETVRITRRGKPIAQITRVQALRKPIDFAALKALTDRLPMQKVSAGNFVRKMREQGTLLTLYLDTSLLVAALTRESKTATVQRWLREQSTTALALSDWTITEFSAALSLKLSATDHRR